MMKTPNLFLITVFAALAIGACKPQNNGNVQTSADAELLKGTINDSTARRLVKNFGGRAHSFKHGGIIRPDTRTVWFSKEQLKALINRIDSEKGDGIRFYLAAYDSVKKSDTKNIKDAYMNYATLIMVSTRYDSLNQVHADYYKNLKGADGKNGGIIMAIPENQGELCPPPATCAKSGATLLP
ncbi:hypothetical protein SAMN05192574_104502 [Mucilaginibacter gossypiicola]|uniref:Uncharacterized protein n=1 Tax=Mucilaginibacter gossypiicola TaxID=551995 RepID=A0A1H8K8C9_9SPHI|nr:hypothetical protein [Mucilaginibacter gossypiicola]SEN89250.1 hypothetical protein SAMN05192574_104502 [Mucilaginibacter gossypiicola]